MPQPNRRILKPVVTTLIREDKHVLMVREGKGSEKGRWNLPGGKVDSGERLFDAAVRETEEETGYRVKLAGLGGIYTYTGLTNRDCMRIVFFAKVIGGEPSYDGTEITDVRWFDLDQVRTMPPSRLCKPAALRRILDDLLDRPPLPLDLVREFDRRLIVA